MASRGRDVRLNDFSISPIAGPVLDVFRMSPDVTGPVSTSVAPFQRGGPGRVHIIGGPGAGKSTVARCLGQALSLPVFELDELRGPNSGTRDADGRFVAARRPIDVRRHEVESIALGEEWITEGVFIGWTEALLRRSDLVVWLDAPWADAVSRILRRHWAEISGDPAPLSGTERWRRLRHPNVRWLRDLLLVTTAYHFGWESQAAIDPGSPRALTRQATATFLEPYAKKIRRFGRPGDALGEVLGSLERQPDVGPLPRAT